PEHVARPLRTHLPTGLCGFRLLIEEYGLCGEFFEAYVDRPADRARPVDRLRRDRNSLPAGETNLSSVLKVDGKASFDHDEQLIRGRVIVPALVPFEACEP